MNPWVTVEYETAADNTGTAKLTKARVYTSDKNGNITSREDRGWIAHQNSPPAPSSFPLLRKTVNTYDRPTPDSLNTSAAATNYYSFGSATNPRNALASTEVQDSAGTVVSRMTRANDPNGNVNQEQRWDSTKAATLASGAALNSANAISSSYAYSAHGNRLSETDPDNKSITYSYGSFPECSACSDLYLTSESHGAVSQLATSYEYNFNTGLRTKVTDANGVRAITTYDAYGRPTLLDEGQGQGATESYTRVYYDDVNRWVYAKSDLRTLDDGLTGTVRYFDQLGRPSRSQQLELTTSDLVPATDQGRNTSTTPPSSSHAILTDFAYVYSTGINAQMVSNPYRTSEGSTAPGVGWTATYRDTAGRVCRVESVAGSGQPTPAANCAASASFTGRTTTSYSAGVATDGKSSTVTDAAGAVRTSYVDAMGRLDKVLENGGAYVTTYGYDLLDNLTSVNAGGQPRSFSYTSLGRLQTATNPETGAINYSYNSNGTLHTRTNRRPVVATMLYDDVNHLLAKSYNLANTPTVSYSYGTVASTCFAKGRVQSVSNSISSTSYCYDSSGRTVRSAQNTGAGYSFTYTYNLAGGLSTIVYPSLRQVSYAFDTAGRVQRVINGTPGSSTNYASFVDYAAHGSARHMTLGNSRIEQTCFNNQLEVSVIRLGTFLTTNCANSGADPMNLGYGYGTGGTNNGNVVQQTVARANAFTAYQYFQYDGVNRLNWASEYGAAHPNASCPDGVSRWCELYGFDQWGNRLIVNRSNLTPLNTEPAAFDGANRISQMQLGGAVHYDPVGNEDLDASGAYEFDGENRIVAYCAQASTCTTSTVGAVVFAYDGEGRRVSKGSSTYVYDAQGRLAAEYSTATPQAGTQYLTADALGSTRTVSDGSGLDREWRDYYPFGGQVLATLTNGRLCGPNCSVGAYTGEAGVRQLFTGKERDAETGLDYFGARYFSGAQGRFTSPDPVNHPSLSHEGPEAFLANPQKWNLYAYALNNPFRFIDPNGAEAASIYLGEGRYLVGGQIIQSHTTPGQAMAQGALEAGGLAGAAFGPALLAGGRALLTGMLGWALGHPTQVQETAASVAEGMSNAPPGSLSSTALGALREEVVAGITGGRIAGDAAGQGMKVTVKGLGSTDVDVIGGAGEYIAVGGAAKALNPAALGRHLQILGAAAKEAGTTAQAYFQEGTPASVLNLARRKLGEENVHVFELPK